MKNLLSIADLTIDQIWKILDTAEELASVTSNLTKKLPVLRGLTVANLFFEDSTRTQLSFESAAKRLSADVINFTAKGSSVSKGESLKDTAQTLEALGAQLMIMRHPSSGAPHLLAESGWIESGVVNAGDGMHQHPTQALLDALTIRHNLRAHSTDFTGLRVTIIGDILHSRVARSNVDLLTKVGAKVTLVGPATLIPLGASRWGVEISHSLDDQIPHSDVVMALRVQNERMSDSFFPSLSEYSRDFGLTKERLALMKDGSIIMHPGPMNRGLEICAEAADSPRSVIGEQVRNGVAIRMAVLYLLLGGSLSKGESF